MNYNPNQPLYGLSLNSIFARCEDRQIVLVSYDKNKLFEFMNEQLAETAYHHDIGGKAYYMSFKLGSPLENFNKPHSFEDAIVLWKSEDNFLEGYREHLKHIIQTHVCI